MPRQEGHKGQTYRGGKDQHHGGARSACNEFPHTGDVIDGASHQVAHRILSKEYRPLLLQMIVEFVSHVRCDDDARSSDENSAEYGHDNLSGNTEYDD